MENEFKKWFEALKENADQHRDIPISKLFNKRDRTIADWIVQLRSLKNSGLLSNEKEDKLNGMGFNWWSEGDLSDENINLLAQCQKSQGQSRISHDLMFEGRPIGRLASKIRILKFLDSLSGDIIQKLEGARFDWNLMPSDFSE